MNTYILMVNRRNSLLGWLPERIHWNVQNWWVALILNSLYAMQIPLSHSGIWEWSENCEKQTFYVENVGALFFFAGCGWASNLFAVWRISPPQNNNQIHKLILQQSRAANYPTIPRHPLPTSVPLAVVSLFVHRAVFCILQKSWKFYIE